MCFQGPHGVLWRVGGSEGCGLERQAWKWDSVCGGVHSGQSPVMTPWEEEQGAESQRRQEKNRWSGWLGVKGRAGLVPRV